MLSTYKMYRCQSSQSVRVFDICQKDVEHATERCVMPGFSTFPPSLPIFFSGRYERLVTPRSMNMSTQHPFKTTPNSTPSVDDECGGRKDDHAVRWSRIKEADDKLDTKPPARDVILFLWHFRVRNSPFTEPPIVTLSPPSSSLL